jgi:negative regulator of sigma E activity
MSRLRLHRSGGDEPPPSADDRVTRELRSLYAAPPSGDRYWDDFEGRIMAAVLAGAARPARVAAHWWQTMADWARPGLAAAAVLAVVVGAVSLQARAARTGIAGVQPAPGLELQPLDPELARAVDETARGDSSAARAAEAASLLTGGVKRGAPVQLDAPAVRIDRRPSDEDDVLRARREATFRYVMPD